MNTINLTTWFVLLCLSLSVALGQPAAPAPALAFLKKAMQKEHIPGLAYAVIKNGQVIAQGTEGMANLSWAAPVDRQTLFQTASCSKLFSALLVGRLVDQHQLSFEQTLGELLDSIPYYWKPITLRQLMAHQSGIWVGDFGGAKSSQQALDIARNQRMEYEPGTRSFYVSSDYWILQALLEKRFSKSYFELLKSYVLEPLALNHTAVNDNDDSSIRTHAVLPKEAAVYAYEGGQYKVSDMQFGRTGYTAGGVYTSIDDLAKVAQVLDEGTFLTPSTQNQLLTPALLKNGKKGDFGIGLVNETYQGHSVSGHSGGPALADFVRFNNEQLTLVVLTNQRGFYPYLAKGLATFYIPNLQMPEVPRRP